MKGFDYFPQAGLNLLCSPGCPRTWDLPALVYAVARITIPSSVSVFIPRNLLTEEQFYQQMAVFFWYKTLK
jgi:hypothetical protein